MLVLRRLLKCQQFRLLSAVSSKQKNKEIKLLSGDLNAILKSYPKTLAKPTSYAMSLYILNKSLTAIIIKHLSEDLRNENACIFEINPGPGILTQAILEAGALKLRVFERNSEFLPRLNELKNLYKSKLEIHESDFFRLPKSDAACRHNLLSLRDTLLNGVATKSWIEDPPLKIFAVAPSPSENVFFRYLLRKYPYFESLFSIGRVEFLIFVSNKEFMHMTAQPEDKYRKYTAISVLYQILFDIEVLCKEPRTSFFPPPKYKTSDSPEFMHLVRLTPKRHLLDVISPDSLHELTAFIRHTFMKRKRLVAETLDHWIAGSSDRLVAEGIHPRLEFGQLTPHQALTLFLYLSSWPEYETCLFKNVVSKMEQDDETVIASEEPEIEDVIDVK